MLSDEQLDCPFIFASAKSGYAMADLDDEKKGYAAIHLTASSITYQHQRVTLMQIHRCLSLLLIIMNSLVRIGVGKIDNGKH